MELSSSASTGGSLETTSETSASTPLPCSALVAKTGSPKRSNSAARQSSSAVSHLFAAMTHGTPDLRTAADADGGILDRERGLSLRLLVERIVRDAAVEGDPARVDEHHLAALHLHLARHAVASDARLVENDGDALLRYAVEERALARVGPADERYDVHGFCLTFA